MQREAVLSPPLPDNILLVERLWTSMILPMLNLQALDFNSAAKLVKFHHFIETKRRYVSSTDIPS